MTASLTVLSGPLAGTRLDIQESEDEILVGSDPDCRLALDVPGVSPIHARLWPDQGALTVHDTRSARGVFVNDARVDGEARLSDGDVLWLGPPGDPDSVMLQYRSGEGAVAAAPEVMVESEVSPLEDLASPVASTSATSAPVAEAHDPLADLGDLFAAVSDPPPPVASEAPAAAAVPDDVFFMEEPVQAAPPPPPPPPPAPAPAPAPAP